METSNHENNENNKTSRHYDLHKEEQSRTEIINTLSDNLYGESIDFVYETNPKYEKIGTKDDYKRYLQTLFRESKIKVPVWHGTGEDFDKFDDTYLQKNDLGFYGKGFYFREGESGKLGAKKVVYQFYDGKGFIKCALVNVVNPLKIKAFPFPKIGFDLGENDGVIVYHLYDEDLPDTTRQICVKSAKQIHMLGSEDDYTGFSDYMHSKIIG